MSPGFLDSKEGFPSSATNVDDEDPKVKGTTAKDAIARDGSGDDSQS